MQNSLSVRPQSSLASDDLKKLFAELDRFPRPQILFLLQQISYFKDLVDLYMHSRMSDPALSGNSTLLANDSDLELLTVERVSELTKLTPQYIYELIRKRELAAVHQGKYLLIPRKGLERWEFERMDGPALKRQKCPA
jgi:excisionase family DNA binding protein